MRGVESLMRELRESIEDERVLEAVAAVPRERFVPPEGRQRAYANCALSIDFGQTISQPIIVARMCELLELGPDDHVLEVGTGSGYHAAVLAKLCAHVWSIERIRELADHARATLGEAGVENVTCLVGDGAEGYPPAAPYDGISVTAAVAGDVPEALRDQLAPGARLVAPVRRRRDERLVLLHRRADGTLERAVLDRVRFVPLVRD